jgi:hypothetical protein
MGKIVCNINEPKVTQHESEYPKIVFAPHDIVDVSADGCVQTGGLGDTWKRYVNPIGPGLYHGLIRIPTEQTTKGALVRIRTAIGTHLHVTGTGVAESQLFLHLGYEDDDYSDNGYYSHDDGTDDQCKTDTARGIDGGPAHVTITIYRGVVRQSIAIRFRRVVMTCRSQQFTCKSAVVMAAAARQDRSAIDPQWYARHSSAFPSLTWLRASRLHRPSRLNHGRSADGPQHTVSHQSVFR